MINSINNTNFFNSSSTNLLTPKKENSEKDSILDAIEAILMSKIIAEKEIKGEKLNPKEQEFKNNNIVIPDPETLVLHLLKSKDLDEDNSSQESFKYEKDKDFKSRDNDILKLQEIINNY